MTSYVQKVLITIGIILALVFSALALYYVFPHFAPFIWAYLFALILEPLNVWLVRHTKLKRAWAVHLTFVAFLGSSLLLGYFLIAKITAELLSLLRYIQKNIPSVQTWLVDGYRQIQDFIQLLPPDLANQINSAFAKFLNQLTNINLLSSVGTRTFNVSTAIPNFFIGLLLFFISLYLISLNLPSIQHKFFSYFKESSRAKLHIVLRELQQATVGFLQAQFILSSITYIVSLTGLMILGVGYALVIALLIVLVDVLPIVGTGSVLVPWAIFSFTKGNTFLGVGLLVLYVVIIIVRKSIEPKILGERIGLSPLATLITIWVGFKVLGVLGVFVGPLLLITYKALVKADVIKFKLRI